MEWRSLPGVLSDYSVSTDGKIKSFVRVKSGRVMQPKPAMNGYVYVTLHTQAGKRNMPLHRLILLGFRGPCPVGMEGSHLNGDRLDNRLANLAWESRVSNQRRKLAHGTALIGSRNPVSKLTDEQVGQIKSLKGKMSGSAIAKAFGLSPSHANAIIAGTRRTYAGK
jgi:hypothetical protein